MHYSKMSYLNILNVFFIFMTPFQALGSEKIKVYANHATLIHLLKPAEAVIVGNPLIADVTIQNQDTLVLTGKGFGTTNLVVIGKEGARILEKSIVVTRYTGSSVRVYRQSSLQTLSCSPFCEGAYRSEAEKESDEIISAQ